MRSKEIKPTNKQDDDIIDKWLQTDNCGGNISNMPVKRKELSRQDLLRGVFLSTGSASWAATFFHPGVVSATHTGKKIVFKGTTASDSD